MKSQCWLSLTPGYTASPIIPPKKPYIRIEKPPPEHQPIKRVGLPNYPNVVLRFELAPLPTCLRKLRATQVSSIIAQQYAYLYSLPQVDALKQP